MTRPTTQAPTISIGTRLTDFATVDLTVEGMASGGMGLVVWGKNAAKGNEMKALKLLKPERLAASHSLEQRRAIERQFEDEALVWCHLWPHQGVVTATGLSRLPALGDLPVLQLDYAPQGSLRDVLRHGRQQRAHPALRATLAWAIHIVSALAHIHQPDSDHDRPAPLVHCDLKPENVLLDEHGWAQLTDLGLTRAYAALAADPVESPDTSATVSLGGLTPHQADVARLRAILQAAGALSPDATAGSAKALAANTATLLATHTLRIPVAPATHVIPAPAPSAGASASRAAVRAGIGSRGPVAGTPPYMAPEQWEGINATLPATDLYAFGVLLYELFAGSDAPHPFPHDPNAYFTLELQAHALQIGYNPVFLAWHAAHMAVSGPAHRLTDPAVAEAALRSGPLAELTDRGDAAGRSAAEAALQQLDALIVACLSLDPAARPSASTMQQQLATLALYPCGVEPIQLPYAVPTTPHNEGVYWSNLGATYSNLGRDEEAIIAKRRGIQHDPDNPDSWFNLGASLDNLGQRERLHAAEAQSGGRPIQDVTALRAAARQHFEEALIAYQQIEAHLTPEILVADPAFSAQIANNQGNTLANLDRYAESVAAYNRALAIQPTNLTTRRNLALVYARWSQEQESDATPADRLSRLQAAQSEIQAVLAVAPNMSDGRRLADAIARALADPAHRFVG